MIRIGLDTNAFQDNWLVRGEAFKLLSDFVAKNEARVYVSEITVQEHVAHYAEQIPGILAKTKTSLGQFSNLLLQGDVAPLPAVRDSVAFETAFRKRLIELGFEVMPIPEVSHAVIVKLDIAHTKPFNSSGKGYRDTLIWLGFLDFLGGTAGTAIFVTNNSKDFGGGEGLELHSDLAAGAQQQTAGGTVTVISTPKLLVEQIVKPRLQVLAEKEAKTQELLKRIKSDDFEQFSLESVVANGIDSFEAQEPTGHFYAGDVVLEEPLWVTTIHDPEHIEATTLFQLAGGSFVCEGTAEVTATVEGYLDKFEAFNQSELGNAFISDEDWNDHYSEVEVSGVSAKMEFSFEFELDSEDILKFEVTKIESL